MNSYMLQQKKDASALAESLGMKLVANEGELVVSSTDSDITRARSSLLSGNNETGDTLHQIGVDFGYPSLLTFDLFWNMYRRFGIARAVITTFPDLGWRTIPTVEGKNEQFNNELESIAKRIDLWSRLKGLDTRQRVGRYGGMYMRVRDGKHPSEPLEMLPGPNALMEMVPLYESQLKVTTTDRDPTSDTFGQPAHYDFNGSTPGNRDDKSVSAFNIHPSRIVIASEGADDGSIYGIPALEAVYNALMDLIKVSGAGGEGFYKNAAQSIVFKLTDLSGASQNTALLKEFSENMDDFTRNRTNRSLMTPGFDANTLESSLASPKDAFAIALQIVSAGSGISASMLVGNQTGKLAGDQDSESTLVMAQSRRENFQTTMTRDILDWMIEFGVLPSSEYEVEWDDLLAKSKGDKLEIAFKMADTNNKQVTGGQPAVFTPEEIRVEADFDEDIDGDLDDNMTEDLPDKEI